MTMRYDDCQMGRRSDCSACSLSNYGKDCHNKPCNQLTYLRSKRGLTQRQVADMAGIAVMQISRLERGETSITETRFKTVIAIADALGVQDLRELI